MKVVVPIMTEIEISPGDCVVAKKENSNLVSHCRVTRLVENMDGLYAVLSDNTWRPMSTYGLTWWKE